jgi:peptidoglycan hydrolase-like protein with peptidoglycan-binding domain
MRTPSGPRWAALSGAGQDTLRLSTANGTVAEISRDEFREHFAGTAVVLWKDAAPQTPVLRQGRSGEVVVALKEQLRRLQRISEGNVSSSYDAETAAAIAKLQAETGLDIDGVAGRQVRLVLSCWAPSTPTPSLDGSVTTSQASAPSVAAPPAPEPVQEAAAPPAAEPEAPQEEPAAPPAIGKSFGDMLSEGAPASVESAAPEDTLAAARDEVAAPPAAEASVEGPVGGTPMPNLSVSLEAPEHLAMELPPAGNDVPAQIQVEELRAPKLSELPPLDLEHRKEMTPPAAPGLPLVPHDPDA